jgi:hypothetical protein
MWRLLVAVMAFVGGAAVVGVVAILVIVVTHDSRRVVVLFLIEVAVLGAGFLLMFWASKQKDKEFAAGYTTSRMGYPNLEQVDEATGLIVRAAGEPLLSRQVRRDRVHAYKAARVGSREG